MKKYKWIFLSILLTILSISIFSPISGKIEVSAAREIVVIQNEKLDKQLRTLLNKKDTDKFYSDDFLNHNDYKPVKDGENFVATKNYLDLSNSKITDIRELALFELPETLKIIDLSYNNITYDNFTYIYNLFNNTIDSEIIIDENYTIISKSNFQQFNCINVSNNNIDLQKVINSPTMNIDNEKFIYGLQNFNYTHNNKIVTREDIKDAQLYVRSNDFNILSNTIYYYTNPAINVSPDHPPIIYPTQTLIHLNDNESFGVGKYEIFISAVPGGYLSNIDFENISYLLIDAKILPNESSTSNYFEVERLDPFNLPTDLIEIKGLGSLEHTKIKDGGTTMETGIQTCQISIIANGYPEKKLELEYKVIDTTAPIITLIGGDTILWNYNTPWLDPGYIITDNGALLENEIIVPPESVKHTQIGEYNLTYTYTDASGNSTTVIRKVIVETGVLSTITLYTTNENIKVGDEITLIASPYNIDKDKYTDFEYTWIINNEIVKIEDGDQTHKSSYILTPKDKNTINVIVKVTAKQVANGSTVLVYSNELKLEPKGNIPATTKTAIIFGSAIIIVMAVITFTTIYKIKKNNIVTKNTKQTKTNNKKTTTKKSKSNKKDDDDKMGITIIKDYKNK